MGLGHSSCEEGDQSFHINQTWQLGIIASHLPAKFSAFFYFLFLMFPQGHRKPTCGNCKTPNIWSNESSTHGIWKSSLLRIYTYKQSFLSLIHHIYWREILSYTNHRQWIFDPSWWGFLSFVVWIPHLLPKMLTFSFYWVRLKLYIKMTHVQYPSFLTYNGFLCWDLGGTMCIYRWTKLIEDTESVHTWYQLSRVCHYGWVRPCRSFSNYNLKVVMGGFHACSFHGPLTFKLNHQALAKRLKILSNLVQIVVHSHQIITLPLHHNHNHILNKLKKVSI